MGEFGARTRGATVNWPEKKQAILAEMRDMERIVVGFSGGVDSAVVAALAFQAVGEQALAVTAVSETLAGRELEEAKDLAKEIGIAHELMHFSELDDPDFRKNTSSRCFFCQSMRFDHLRKIAERAGVDVLASGTNADDIGDDRPGLAAMTARGIYQPLLSYGVTKIEVRQIARELGLSVWDKPAAACLSSRIPHGTEVTFERLKRIELGEDVLHSYGFTHSRVRDHKGVARLELDPNDWGKLLSAGIKDAVIRELKSAGFQTVLLDLCGYRPAGKQ